MRRLELLKFKRNKDNISKTIIEENSDEIINRARELIDYNYCYEYKNIDNEIIKYIENNLRIELFKTSEIISAREEVCNRLESNWNKLKEYLNYKSERAVGEDEYVYDEIYNEMQEMEQVSDSDE